MNTETSGPVCGICGKPVSSESILVCWDCAQADRRRADMQDEARRHRNDRVHAASRALATMQDVEGMALYSDEEAAKYAIKLVDAVDAALLAGRSTP